MLRMIINYLGDTMYSELNKKLEEVQQKVYRLNKIDSILAELRNDAS